jgi:hypothetical protein
MRFAPGCTRQTATPGGLIVFQMTEFGGAGNGAGDGWMRYHILEEELTHVVALKSAATSAVHDRRLPGITTHDDAQGHIDHDGHLAFQGHWKHHFRRLAIGKRIIDLNEVEWMLRASTMRSCSSLRKVVTPR